MVIDDAQGLASMIYDVIVVGAGLAGCSAAIQLAQAGWQVLLLEQQRYPAHKLCGEFLSVEVIANFARLGVLEAVQQIGAHPIHRALVTTAAGANFAQDLPGTALGLSRFQLDSILFRRAAAVGAICCDRTTVRKIEGNLDTGFSVRTTQGTFQARAVLAAYGKRSTLDTQLDRPFTHRPSPWVAFKAHCTGLDLPGTIELHAFPGGYCGLSAIETGQINLCWIGHRKILQDADDPNLPDVLHANPVLHERLSHLSYGHAQKHRLRQISFALKGNFDGDICMLGDTAGMITPLCGDGMAMALRTAELATPLVDTFLKRELTAVHFKQQYQTLWRREFQSRLQLGRMLHAGFIQPQLAHISVGLCQMFPTMAAWVIRNTRGATSEEQPTMQIVG
ncbi:NAD(P)/FAD-dependent oxidoreductase [Adonisia turfae]|nr:NAD(P)/FAD-dependent oxidoreductase [Adonisia turfae]